MKTKAIILSLTILSIPALSTNYVVGVTDMLCSNAYVAVKRADDNMKQSGSNLSKTARSAIFSNIYNDLQTCLSNCSGKDFSYCNAVAKKLEKK